MRVYSKRKLFLFGRYSLALLLPKKWLSSLNVKRGDEVELKFDRKRSRIIVSFASVSGVKKIATKTEKIKSKTKNKESDDDLEPIPQL